jgi:AraC-like DNA-binding protein
MSRAELSASKAVIRALEDFLRNHRIRHLHFSDRSTVPPVLAQVTNVPRLSISLAGHHDMDISESGLIKAVRADQGHAVFVPEHAWNRMQSSADGEVLSFLFGGEQIEMTLARYKEGAQAGLPIKTTVHGGYDVPTRGLLVALMDLAPDGSDVALARLLTESLLQACLRLLKSPHRHPPRKAVRTYESICLYVQANFRDPISRESVAAHFRLAPNHVSRVFRKEGLVRFNDYLNLVRVNRAKFMLQTYGTALKEIARDCGYSDPAYFCRVFKKICKLTPTEYRARAPLNGARPRTSRMRLARELQAMRSSEAEHS